MEIGIKRRKKTVYTTVIREKPRSRTAEEKDRESGKAEEGKVEKGKVEEKRPKWRCLCKWEGHCLSFDLESALLEEGRTETCKQTCM
jgi:hypothetical protein